MPNRIEIGDTVKVLTNLISVCEKYELSYKSLVSCIGNEFTVIDIYFDDIWMVTINNGNIPLECCKKL